MFIKYTKIKLLILLIFIAILVSSFLPKGINAEFKLPNSTSTLYLNLKGAFTVTAEYDRTLILKSKNQEKLTLELVPDTGGYKRSQLYQINQNDFVLQGYFDSTHIDLTNNLLTKHKRKLPANPIYLGAFDNLNKEGWQFYSAAQSAEKILVAKGG